MALDLNDKTANGNTLTNNGGTEYTASTPFAASTIAVDLERDTPAYLTAADHASLDITTTISIEAWVKQETAGTNAAPNTIIIKGRTAGGNDTNYAFRIRDLIEFFYYDGTTFHVFGGNTGLTDTTSWHHLAVTYTFGTGSSIKIYLDGTDITSGGAWSSGDGNAAAIANNEALQIGCINYTTTPAQILDGQLDDIRIWNDIRTQQEIQDNDTIELTGTEANLVAYWPFEALTSARPGKRALLSVGQ